MPTKIVKQTKSNSASFYSPQLQYLDYIRSTYVNAGKLTITRNVVGENEIETVFDFTTESDRVEFLQDPVVNEEHQRFLAHINDNNIVVDGNVQ